MMAEQPGPLSRLARQDWWTRRKAIAELAAAPEDCLGYLEEGIRNHDNADVRNTAMEVFRELGTRAFPALAGLLKDSDPEVRLFAVNILSEIALPEALPLLFDAATDKDVNVRVASAEAMGRIGDRSALGLLSDALDDEPWVAMAAIHAIGEIGGEESLELLHKCLGREEYREIAIAALEKAGNRHSIRYLTSCIEDGGQAVLALKAIVKISEREAVRPQPEYFIGLVPALLKMIESPDPAIKGPAFTALCWSGDIMALPCFIDAARDEDLMEYAVEGLLAIGRRAVCSIVDEMKVSSGRHRQVLARVLSLIGEGNALLQFAEDEDPEVRTEAALALGSLHLRRAEGALSRMLSDPDEEVRAAARLSFRLLKKGCPDQ